MGRMPSKHFINISKCRNAYLNLQCHAALDLRWFFFFAQVTVVAKACRETSAPEATKYTEVARNEQSEARNGLCRTVSSVFLLSFWCSALLPFTCFQIVEFETRSQLFLSIENSTPAFRIRPMHTGWIRAVLCGMSTVLVQMTPASLGRGAASSSMTFITWCQCLNPLSAWSCTAHSPKMMLFMQRLVDLSLYTLWFHNTVERPKENSQNDITFYHVEICPTCRCFRS